MAEQNEFNVFAKKFEELKSQEGITEQEFLNATKQAVAAYKEDSEKRKDIAYKMTGLWLVAEEKMGETYTEKETVIAKLGSEFNGLELPDHVANVGDYGSVEEKLQGLAQKINDAIQV